MRYSMAMLHASAGERFLWERAWLRRERPTWNVLAPDLQVRVGSRSARVLDALQAGDDPAHVAAWSVPLGPRLALDLVVRAERRLIPVAHHLEILGVPLSVALRVALHEPRRWLRPGGGGEPGTVHLAPLPNLPGVAAVDIHDGAQLAGLLLPPERLLPGGQPVILPLTPARVLVADVRNIEGLRSLLATAEGARDDPQVVCVLPHAYAASEPGAFSWAPWRPPTDHPLHGWMHRMGLLQDCIDDRRTLQAWSDARPELRTQGLTLTGDPRAAGRIISVARWPQQPCSLPAADCFDVEGPDGGVVRVWVDQILDLLSAQTAPLPGAWPPRFVAAGGVGAAHWATVQARGRASR